MVTASHAPDSEDLDSYHLQCLEIWGGTAAADESVSVPGLDLEVFCRPYRGAARGGDVYLVSSCGAGNIARILLADVAGHGMAVGRLGHRLKQLMRRHITTLDPSRLARGINEEFTRASKAGRFATAILATYFAPTDHLIVVNAGHPPPLWFRADRGTWEILEPPASPGGSGPPSLTLGRTNLPLGILHPTLYTRFAVRLAPEDLLLLYTDALTDVRESERGVTGPRGLLDLVRRRLGPHAFETLSVSVLDALEDSRRGREWGDDLTLITIRHNAADPPRPSLGERLRIFGRMLGLGRLGPDL